MSILKFSRRSPPIYEAVARFYPNGEKGKSVAVIYSASSPFSSEYKTYYLMVYDLKGNVIFPTKDPKHDRLLGGFHIASNEVKNSTSCEISQDGLITIKNYENEWEKDYNNFGAADNRIVGHTLIDQKIYQFDDRGMAVEQSVNKPDALAAMK